MLAKTHTQSSKHTQDQDAEGDSLIVSQTETETQIHQAWQSQLITSLTPTLHSAQSMLTHVHTDTQMEVKKKQN